jgi:hypothetical protein
MPEDSMPQTARPPGAISPIPLFRAPSAGAFGSDLVAPDAPCPPLWIAEFDPERDAIEIVCPPGPARTSLALIESETRTELRLNGAVVARFAAGCPVALSDILLVPRDGPAR